MTGQTIWGVDYSGAKDDRGTWLTKAVLQGNVLRLEICERVSREELTSRLVQLSNNPDISDVIVGMDFPFGLPCDFIREELKLSATKMPEVWEYASGLDLPNHIPDLRQRLRNGDLKKYSKLQRKWDRKCYPQSFSPLNPASPEMFPMTFYGMKMLHHLRKAGCRVPPLPDENCGGPLLLEIMPGVLLRDFNLPAENYKNKNKTNRGNPEKVRREILDGLEGKSDVLLQIPGDIRQKCIENHNGLDSLVAAVGATVWAKDKTLFHSPEDDQDPAILDAAQLEGCIYGIKSIKK